MKVKVIQTDIIMWSSEVSIIHYQTKVEKKTSLGMSECKPMLKKFLGGKGVLYLEH